MTDDDKKTSEVEENNENTALETQLSELQARADEYLDSLQRERASFANYKRRIDQENTAMAERLLGEHVRIFLPVVDDLERALEHAPADPDCANWIAGVELILKKLLSTLEKQNVTVIDLKPGDLFDPNNQEAVTHEENENYTDGQIIEVVQTGYQLKERIIRPALVRVAK